jgi:hypothetical protein
MDRFAHLASCQLLSNSLGYSLIDLEPVVKYFPLTSSKAQRLLTDAFETGRGQIFLLGPKGSGKSAVPLSP